MRNMKRLAILLIVLFSCTYVHAHTSRITRLAAIKIGTRITGATPGSLLFVDLNNKIAEDNANLFYDDATNQLKLGGTLLIKERTSAIASIAAFGQIWVKDGAPNTLFFTDDAGTDFQLGVGGGSVEGTDVVSTGESVGKVLQADGDDTSSWVTLPGGGDALTTNPLSQFAATTSLQFIGVISDETGTGKVVFATSPTFLTSIIMGAAVLSEAELEILDGATVSTTEFNYLVGVTSSIQTQLNAKQATVTDGNALTFTGATLDFDGGATPSGDLGGTWASPTVTGVQANSVVLGTDTTGNYAATIADAGNSTITVANSGTESAAITLDLTANGVDDTHIDFGTGANQVSLDDIPEGTTRYYINNSFNGTFKEEFDATVTSNGTTVTMSIQATDGGDLTEQFSSGLTTFDTTPAVTIALTAGTDSSPQNNWIYILQSAPGTLVKSTSTWPTAEHIRIAFLVVQSAASVQSATGTMVNQNWNNSLTSNADSMGESSHIAERMRINLARYFSGVDGNGTDNYLTPTAGNVEFISTSGTVYQVHAHTFPVINTSTGSELHVKNWSGDAFHALTNLYDIVDDSTGTTITNNKFFNLVFWGVANKGGEHQTVMINLPGGSYNTQASAEADSLGFDDFGLPREFTLDSSTGFLITRMTIQMKTGGGTWIIASSVDLRGSNPQTARGGASSVVTTFADNAFDIFDNTDNTKEMVFDVGASITTGTTRTYTAPDADGTLALTSQSDGTIVLGTNTTGSYAAGSGEAGAALTGDSATSFFSSGTIEHERGGLEANISAYNGLVGVTGGATFNQTGTTTQIVIFDGAGAPTSAALSGDTSMTNGGVVSVNSVQPNSVALTTGTTGNYSTGNAEGGDALVSIAVEITDNESTAEENPIVFVAGAAPAGGDLPLETDGTCTYNPSTGNITATGFTGALTGNADTTTTNANLTGIVTSVGNATAIADKAIAIAKLADGTDGELITWDAAGVITTVSVGTADEVLTSNGVGAAPTFKPSTGYALQTAGAALAPADSTAYFTGGNASIAPSTTATIQKLHIPKAGTVKAIYVFFLNVTAQGTAETSTISFRLNDTTDTTISAVVQNDILLETFSNTGLSITVAQGDFFELKWVTPAWVTNPQGVFISSSIYIE